TLRAWTVTARTCTVDDTGTAQRLADGSRESITWTILASVMIRVKPESPWQEDVFFMLANPDGTGTAVPSSDPAAEALLEHLQLLPGFDHDRFVEALTTDADEAYVVWKSDES